LKVDIELAMVGEQALPDVDGGGFDAGELFEGEGVGGVFEEGGRGGGKG
jgi:hypothetical protein